MQRPAGFVQSDRVRLGTQLRLDTVTTAELELPMVTALEVGEMFQIAADRPSLLLQRMGEEDLWNLAKATGSTVEAIRKANDLQEEPEVGQMLLIPIL